MTSRTKRKRHRRRMERLKATALPEIRGLWGDILSRSDMVLLQQAIRNDWPIPQHVADVLTKAVSRTLDDDVPAIQKIRACQVVVEMDLSNLRRVTRLSEMVRELTTILNSDAGKNQAVAAEARVRLKMIHEATGWNTGYDGGRQNDAGSSNGSETRSTKSAA